MKYLPYMPYIQGAPSNECPCRIENVPLVSELQNILSNEEMRGILETKRDEEQ